jgi:iron complex outermembrane receptor protein
VPIHYSKGTPTYLVGLNYRVDDDIFAYAKFSTAYISGGVIANVPFNPATARSYEIGLKSDLLDHKLRVNLAAYTVKYGGLQVDANTQVGCISKPNVSLNAPQCILNGGDARANGFEAEVTYVPPLAGLTLSGNLAYTNLYFTDLDPTLRNPVDGTFVSVYTPEWTGSLTAQYTGPDIEWLRRAHPIARIQGNYTSSAYGYPNSTLPVTIAGKIPSRWIVDARFGLGGFQIGGTDVELAGFVKNLTDNKSITFAFNAGPDIPAMYQEARTYGVDLIVEF